MDERIQECRSKARRRRERELRANRKREKLGQIIRQSKSDISVPNSITPDEPIPLDEHKDDLFGRPTRLPRIRRMPPQEHPLEPKKKKSEAELHAEQHRRAPTVLPELVQVADEIEPIRTTKHGIYYQIDYSPPLRQNRRLPKIGGAARGNSPREPPPPIQTPYTHWHDVPKPRNHRNGEVFVEALHAVAENRRQQREKRNMERVKGQLREHADWEHRRGYQVPEPDHRATPDTKPSDEYNKLVAKFVHQNPKKH